MAVTPLTDRHDQSSGTTCPDAELIASYIDGLASPQERAEIESHVATCEDCYFVLAETIQEQRQRSARTAVVTRTRPAWIGWVAGLAVAAALMLALRIAGPFRRVPQESTTVSLPNPTGPAVPSSLTPAPKLDSLNAAVIALDASTGPFRPLEPRLAGSFQYRPLKPVIRSAVSAEELPEAVREAAQRVSLLAAGSGPGTSGQRALAEMYLMTGKPERAVEILEPEAKEGADVVQLTDLAAAYLARGAAADGALARAAAERAVERDPQLPAAWFNLALAEEAVDLPERATEAWTKFLELDSASGWATEARHHLDRLTKRPRR